MVAIAVFSIVMVTATSALLNVIDANAKARSVKTAINNLSLALEGISKDMRMGTDYGCFDSTNTWVEDCSDGGTAIKYKSPRAFLLPDGERKYAYYKFESEKLWECLEDDSGDNCSLPGAIFDPITSGELEITEVKFYIIGVEGSDYPIPNKTQPRMVMTLSGVAGKNREKTKTEFDLQTSVSQRIRPEENP